MDEVVGRKPDDMEPGPQGSAKLSLLGRAVRDAYGRGQEDEALEPIVLADPSGRPIGRPEAGDAVIFYDLRGEREVELTRSLTDEDFSHFPVRRGLGLHFVTMIEYSSQLRVKVAFPPQERLGQTLVEVLTRAGLRPVKIAESEKAVHVGFFLNGKREEPFAGERRVIVPSPSGDVSYALRPEMSAREVGQNVLAALDDETADVIIANLANVDVVGHLESREAVLAAVETVDSVLGQIAEAAARKKAALIVTADHGTVEEWLYPDGSVNTGHTRSRVPFILADFGLSRIDSARLKPEGELADVAPTVLRRLGVPAPEEMTGKSLVDEGAGGKEGGRSRLLLLPVVAGLAYEVTVKWAGSRPDNPFVKVLLWPGLQLQRLTTREPTPDQLDVAAAALDEVIKMDERRRLELEEAAALA